MTDIDQRKQEKRKTGFSPVVAAVAGAIVGAGVAVAGAAVLDKKNRKKVEKAFTNVKNQATGYIKELKKEVKETKKEINSTKGDIL